MPRERTSRMGPFAATVAQTAERIAADRSGAVVTICAEAVGAARVLDRAARSGPLVGLPITAKDVLASAGTLSQAGSRALAGYVPSEDAPAIALLRAAGAVLVGKTNCSELALTPWTGNELFGETRHPSAPGRSPGGSSGGCAAAIAVGLVPLSLGTDYGGSVRLPAAACGIVAASARCATSTRTRTCDRLPIALARDCSRCSRALR
jgi:Asp-tRNA(Asn)/Glu-tRNA(Gln) amidotransferase A subunit family amidase